MEEPLIQYTVKELLIGIHDKIDVLRDEVIQDRKANNTRLVKLEDFKSRAKGASAVLALFAATAGALLSHYV
jgi:hypothetical protein